MDRRFNDFLPKWQDLDRHYREPDVRKVKVQPSNNIEIQNDQEENPEVNVGNENTVLI